MAVSTAFCASVLLGVGARSKQPPSQAARTSSTNILRATAAGPPRRVGAAVSGLREAMQTALSARRSRLAVRLPDGARLGLERGGRGGASGASDFVRADRELARCVAALFDGTGLRTCVVFSAAGEMRAAQKAFGPAAECRFDCWEDSAARPREPSTAVKAQSRRARGRSAAKKAPPPKATAGAGFGAVADPVAAVQPGEVMAAGGFDVYVVVAPKQSCMARVRQLCERYGDDVLVVLANGRVERMQGLPKDTENYLMEAFEDVYFWVTDPSPTFSGGVLFRKFPDDWVLGRATPVGTMQRLLESPDKPSVDEVTARLKQEAEKPTSGILNRVADFIEGRN